MVLITCSSEATSNLQQLRVVHSLMGHGFGAMQHSRLENLPDLESRFACHPQSPPGHTPEALHPMIGAYILVAVAHGWPGELADAVVAAVKYMLPQFPGGVGACHPQYCSTPGLSNVGARSQLSGAILVTILRDFSSESTERSNGDWLEGEVPPRTPQESDVHQNLRGLRLSPRSFQEGQPPMEFVGGWRRRFHRSLSLESSQDNLWCRLGSHNNLVLEQPPFRLHFPQAG